ncbi:hypothetical protein SAY86_013476 [Trapa natans]|uniref:GBF-interacting protein 1 N-terminal domain-containing protein n=1 Tax=Trapa natans TaxID=22666 RepID=A0AAN7RA54_TRANT|nr:hypothetical protein SAY86_013476 [Trapa natans]
MSSSGGGSRVSIPDDVLRTIQNIRESTGKQHSDEDVYAMYMECAMDPDETAQKLLFVDTFKEVKSRRDKRKESSISKMPESKLASENQGRGVRGNRNPSNHSSSGGSKNMPFLREKRMHNFRDKGSGPAPVHQQKTKDNAGSPAMVASNSPNRMSSPVPAIESLVENHVNATETSVSNASFPLDPIVVTPLLPHSGPGPVQREAGPKRMPSVNSVYKKKVTNKSESIEKDHVLKYLQPLSTSCKDQSLTSNPSSETVNEPVEKAPAELEVITSEVASLRVEPGPQSMPTLTVSDEQNVTFPNHFQVSEAFRSGLTFGSFDGNFGARTEVAVESVHNDKFNNVVESPQESDENVKESSLRGHHVVDIVDHSQPTSNVHPSENNVISSLDMTHQEPQQDKLTPSEACPNPIVQNGQSNGFDFISPIISDQNGYSKVSESQVPDISIPSYFVNGNDPTLSSPSTSPPPAVAQSSMSASQQHLPVFRQPYPFNYFPYGHYLTPIYMPPIHQLLSHNAFAQQQPTAGNFYMPPTIAGPGVKLPFNMLKSGSNAAPPIGIPSGYSSMGYTASPTVTSGVSATNEDLAASQLKENHIYSTTQLSEGPPVWIPSLAQDMTSMQVNSLYNVPQGQHLTFTPPQVSHGPFGMQQPVQALAGAPTAHPLLQQSQGATVESVGLPSGAYQLPQLAQLNWNTNF